MKYPGGWTTVGVPGFSTGFMTNVIALAVENGVPYVAYRDYGANYKVSAMKFNTTYSSWELLKGSGFTESLLINKKINKKNCRDKTGFRQCFFYESDFSDRESSFS